MALGFLCSSWRLPLAALASPGQVCLIAAALSLAACNQASPIIEATTRLASTSDTVGPYVVGSVIVGVDGETVELHYAVGADPFVPLPMVATPGTDLFEAGIPGQATGSRVQYYVSVARDGTRLAIDPEGGAALPYHFDIVP